MQVGNLHSCYFIVLFPQTFFNSGRSKVQLPHAEQHPSGLVLIISSASFADVRKGMGGLTVCAHTTFTPMVDVVVYVAVIAESSAVSVLRNGAKFTELVSCKPMPASGPSDWLTYPYATLGASFKTGVLSLPIGTHTFESISGAWNVTTRQQMFRDLFPEPCHARLHQIRFDFPKGINDTEPGVTIVRIGAPNDRELCWVVLHTYTAEDPGFGLPAYVLTRSSLRFL